MRKGSLLGLAMAGAMLLGAVPVSAAQINVPADPGTATGNTPTQFEVTEDMLGGGLVVSVPDELILQYSAEDQNFSASDNVNAKGNINPAKKLNITTPATVTYLHEDDATVDAVGTIDFGTENTETWSANELRVAKDAGVDKAIKSTVPMSEVEYVGTYSTTINYDINVVDK